MQWLTGHTGTYFCHRENLFTMKNLYRLLLYEELILLYEDFTWKYILFFNSSSGTGNEELKNEQRHFTGNKEWYLKHLCGNATVGFHPTLSQKWESIHTNWEKMAHPSPGLSSSSTNALPSSRLRLNQGKLVRVLYLSLSLLNTSLFRRHSSFYRTLHLTTPKTV